MRTNFRIGHFKIWALAVVMLLALLTVSVGLAAVTTDKADYVPGEIVTITGDGYTAGETIDIEVTAPYGTETGQATADENGAFTWSFTLPADESADGAYTYTATGQTSGVSQSGTFTDNATGQPSDGSCNTGVKADVGGDVTGNITTSSLTGLVVTATAGAGNIITGVCIKTGQSAFAEPQAGDGANADKHSILFTTDGTYGIDDCYTVSGLGNPQATVTKGTASGCKDISHIDYKLAVDDDDGTVVVADTTVVTTAIHLGSDHATNYDVNQLPVPTVTPSVALGSTIHDQATVTNTSTVPLNGTPQGTVSFTFYSDLTCTTPASIPPAPAVGNPVGNPEAVALVLGVAESTDTAQLHAGSYSYKVVYTSSDTTKWGSSSSNCEAVTVNKGDVTNVTEIHEFTSTNPHVVKTGLTVGETIHDKAIITGILVTGFEPTGTVDFHYRRTSDCSGTDVVVSGSETSATPSTYGVSLPGTSNPGSVESNNYTTTGADAGDICYFASYSGSSDYNAKDSAIEPIHVSLGTPGYWKNNETAGNLPQTLALADVSRTYLGYTVTHYAEDLATSANEADAVSIFNAMNCSDQKSAVNCLAGHLLAAKLNLKASYGDRIDNVPDIGATTLQNCIDTEIDSAVKFLTSKSYTGPGTYTMSKADRATFLALKDQLDRFNNGIGCSS